MKFSRRSAIASGIGVGGGVGFLTDVKKTLGQADGAQTGSKGGPVLRSLSASTGPGGDYALPPLPYAYEALEPAIDAEPCVSTTTSTMPPT